MSGKTYITTMPSDKEIVDKINDIIDLINKTLTAGKNQDENHGI